MLMGGAIAVTIAVVAGFKAAVPDGIRNGLFICVGLSMGASVAPDTLQLLGQWPITLAALVIELFLIVTLCGLFLVYVFKLDNGTAYLSSFPGHLSFVVALAAAGTGDPRQIVVIQVMRVALLTLCALIGALFLPVGSFGGNGSLEMMAPTTLLMAAMACAGAGWAFARFRIPAGYVLGSMAVATALKLTGYFPGTLPQPLVEVTFIGMGALIGSRFSGISRADIAKALAGGLGSTAIAVAIVTVTAYVVSHFVDMPIGQIWLGLSPGGLESMGALGIALGYDTAFIAAHHVFRLLLLTFAIPVVAVMFRTTKTAT
jgi:membrane AbrB-like protein